MVAKSRPEGLPKIQAYWRHMPKANFIHLSSPIKAEDLQEGKHGTLLSQQCLLPSEGLGVSKMLRKPSRCDTPLTPSRALLERQLEARQDAFRRWNVTRCPCFAKCIQFQMSLTRDTIACYWSGLRLGINTVIHITTVPFFFFLVSLGKYS